MQASIKNLFSLKNWFFHGNKPIWRLYSGTKKPPSGITIAQNLNENSVDRAFTLLRGELQNMNNVGTFFITVNTSKSANSSSEQGIIIDLDPYSSFSNNNINQPVNGFNSNSSNLGALSQLSELSKIFGVGNNDRYSPDVRAFIDSEVERRVKDEKRIIEQGFEIEKIKLVAANGKTKADKAFDKFIENPLPMLTGIKSIFSGQSAQLGTLKGNQRVDADLNDTQSNKQPRAIDFNRINHSVIALAHMGFGYVPDLLWMIARIAKDDPSTVKLQLEMLKAACEAKINEIQQK